MVSVLKITRLHFAALANMQIAICASVLALHIVISVGIIRLAHVPGPAGVGDVIGMSWILIMGIIFFAPSFKYILAQGLSRRTYFLGGSLSMAAMAAAIAIVVTIFYIINLKVSNVWMIYELIYDNSLLAAVLVWEFAALLFLGVLGWLVRLAYYVSGRTAKIVLTVSPFVLAALLALINALAGGGMGRAIYEFLKTALGVSAGGNPYIGVASLLAASLILLIPVFLLLRRAQVND